MNKLQFICNNMHKSQGHNVEQNKTEKQQILNKFIFSSPKTLNKTIMYRMNNYVVKLLFSEKTRQLSSG